MDKVNVNNVKDVVGLVCDKKINNQESCVLTISDASLYSGINNYQTTFPFRLAYAIWVLSGSNLLKPLSYYGKQMDDMTDDGVTLRGAYGPRLRFWVGPDALQEAININQDISNPEDFVKPVGLDQLEAVFKDFQSGMSVGTIGIFDPALDFEETLYVPDLNCVTFLSGRKIDMIMNYSTIDVTGHLQNDIWLFEFVKWVLATFLDKPCGETNVVIGSATFDIDTFELQDASEEEKIKVPLNIPQAIKDKHVFWDEFETLQVFERHMRLQINDKTFINDDVNIVELSEILVRKLLSKIETQVLKDMGYSLLVCSLMKYADKIEIYNDFIGEIINKISTASFIVEIYKYSKYCSAYHSLPALQKIADELDAHGQV